MEINPLKNNGSAKIKLDLECIFQLRVLGCAEAQAEVKR